MSLPECVDAVFKLNQQVVQLPLRPEHKLCDGQSKMEAGKVLKVGGRDFL